MSARLWYEPKVSRRRRKKKGRSRVHVKDVLLELSMLEMARGHDGPMRGLPEPTLLVAVYLVAKTGDRLLARALRRFEPRRAMPQDITPHEDVAQLAEQRYRPVPDDKILVLAIGVEEDASSDIEAIYADLPRLARWRAWPVDARVPHPEHLEEIARAWPVEDPLPRRVHLMLSDEDLRDRVTKDDYVGASVLSVPAHLRHDETQRFVLTCDEEKNDWTAVLGLRIR